MKPEVAKFFRTYAEAGVNRWELQRLRRIAWEIARSTFRPEIIKEIDGLIVVDWKSISQKFHHPVIRSETDGVGSKEKLAVLTNKIDNIGYDLVAANVNDLIRFGIEPVTINVDISFSDIDEEVYRKILLGVRQGCVEAGCSLVGGETAQIPDFLPASFFHLSATALGIGEANRLVSSRKIREGDQILAILTSSLGTNGFSLVRKVFEGNLPWQIELAQLGDQELSEVLLEKHPIYVREILALLEKVEVSAIAHITGGGIFGKLGTIMPQDLVAVIRTDSWQRPPIIDLVKNFGRVSEYELWRTFNMGIGMALVVSKDKVDETLKVLNGFKREILLIGEISKRKNNQRVILVN